MLTRRDQALKDDCRRDVPLWLAELKLPEVHSLELYGLPLDRILEDSLFYPAAGIDGRPIQFLAGFINSFIYADYGLGPLELEDAMLNAAFLGYRISGKRSLPQDDLVPKGWLPVIPQKYQSEELRSAQRSKMGFIKPPFANWYIFDRESKLGEAHGPQRFSLVYICADGVETYQALYWQNRIAPKVLTIIQPGTGFGGNYTDFRDPDGFFAWTVLYGNHDFVPKYLAYGGSLLNYDAACWPDAYPNHVEWWQHINGNGVWGRPTT